MKTSCLCLLSLMFLAVASPVAAETMVPLAVKAGSSLINLANLYCHGRENWRRIAEVNNLRAPYVILEDTTLLVPAGLLLGENVSAVIGAVHGQARLSSASMASRPVSIGDKVPPGMMVETGKNGYVLLIFPDQRFVRVDADSALRVDFALRLADGSVKIQTTLQQGSSLNDIKPRTRVNDSFDSRTPTALTGVRGTVYRLKTHDDSHFDPMEDSHVETLRGEVYATAMGVTRAIPMGHGAVVRKNQPPSRPRPLPASPNGFVAAETYNSQPLHFQLPDKPKTGSMRLIISRDEQGLRLVERRLGKAGETLAVTLPEDGRYFLSLTAIDGDGFESLPTPPKAFTLRTSPAPPILTIQEKAPFFTPSAPLSWAEVKEATSYRAMVAKDSGFSQPVHEATVATPSWHTPDLPLGTYYVRVQSVASDGYRSPWSGTAAFIIAEPPKLFENALTADGPIHLRWSAAQEGEVYDLQVAAQPDFGEVLAAAEGLRQPEYTLKDQLQPGVYYLRIRDNLPGGPASPWGPTQKITISPAPMTLADKVIVGLLILCAIL